MACSEFQHKLRPWIRGELSGLEAKAVERHIADCYFCTTTVVNESAILETLKSRWSVPEPSEGFHTRMLAAAARRTSLAEAENRGESLVGDKTVQPGKRSPTFSLPVFGGAIAAAMVLGIALGLGFQPDAPAERPQFMVDMAKIVESRSVSSGQQVVRLAFSTSEAMDNVTLTVELPPHVEMADYPGDQTLSWNVSFAEGQNIVKLPLKVLFPGEGELIAHLDDGQSQKTFRTSLSPMNESSR